MFPKPGWNFHLAKEALSAALLDFAEKSTMPGLSLPRRTCSQHWKPWPTENRMAVNTIIMEIVKRMVAAIRVRLPL
jgi:hypothetical protein